MLIKIIRWLRGYVIFTVSGRFPERFINLLNQRGVLYWNFVPCKEGHRASMSLYDYLHIRKIARRSSVRLRKQKAVGLPFFIKNNKKRKGIFIGGVCALLLMSFLNQFIWVIEINGTNRISDVQVIEALQESGLTVGTYKNTMDVDTIEKDTILRVPDIGWMSINAINNIAKVEIKEKAKSPKISNSVKPCNLKALCDGVITSTTVVNGNCLVKRGSAVVKNQLLVSSVIEDNNQNLTYVHSEGEILADVNEEKTFTVNTDNSYTLDKNYTEKSKLNFLSFSIPFEMSSSHKGEKLPVFKQYRAYVNNVTLPLGKTVCRNYYCNTNEKLNSDIAINILKKKIKLQECFEYSKGKIKSKKVNFIQKGNNYTANVIYIINKNIAVKQKLSVRS